MKRHWKRWTLIAVVVGVVLVVGGPFVYINFIEDDAPKRLSVSTAPSSGTGQAVSADGTWKAGAGSQSGYRVKEVLFGQDTEAVGRTSKVTGDISIAGASVSKGAFTVDMASVASDQSRRDDQFRGRIMDVSAYPAATFTLTGPIDLGSVPAVGTKVTAKASGDLELRGTKKSVTFDVAASRTGADTFEVSGSIPVKFSDWKIPDPSIGPIRTEDNGQVEFLLKFTRA